MPLSIAAVIKHAIDYMTSLPNLQSGVMECILDNHQPRPTSIFIVSMWMIPYGVVLVDIGGGRVDVGWVILSMGEEWAWPIHVPMPIPASAGFFT